MYISIYVCTRRKVHERLREREREIESAVSRGKLNPFPGGCASASLLKWHSYSRTLVDLSRLGAHVYLAANDNQTF